MHHCADSQACHSELVLPVDSVLLCVTLCYSVLQLPKEIGNLVSLQSLDVSHNKQLSTLPDELGRCTRLWEVCLCGVCLCVCAVCVWCGVCVCGVCVCGVCVWCLCSKGQSQLAAQHSA